MGGDFNARTATLSHTIDISDLCELLQTPEFARTEQPNIVTKRQNRVASVSSWGRQLLNLYGDVGLLILNGRTPGDKLREFTCLENGGRSIVDYIVGSPAIWQAATHLEVIIDDTRYCTMGGDSDHRPLNLQLNINCIFVEPQHTTATKKFLPRFKYDKSKVEQYQLALTTSLGNLWVANSIGHLGVDGLIDLLQQCMGAVAKSTFGNKLSGGRCKMQHCHKPWFDADCRIAKCELKLWLKANRDSHVVKHQQNNLKKLFKRKRICWEIARAQHMCSLAKVDVPSFWKKYQPNAPMADKISAITLLEGFRKLVGQSSPPIQLQIDHSAQMMEPPPSHILNTDITFTELLQALKKVQRNKAAGLDGMKIEFILDVGGLLHIPLLTTFNCFLEEGFPETLSTGVVHVLFKGGDASKFDNYRGITVGPILAKLFTMILEKRLSEWVEQHGLRAKGQAGFRKDYRTIDQLFILRTLIKQSKAKKKPLYCCFVDFKKVFDTVPREMLWQVLASLRVEGRFLQCLQAMYAKDIVRINHPSKGVTSSFRCQQGVKQGCPLSPLLFGLYLDALEGCLDDRECDAPTLADVHVWLLLFADDVVLTSELEVGLQQKLDTLQ
jgi:hypothetical protein